jgi:lipid II:glycine glycyltransferase (peptidoglycan interpeptide bridge formation enzyme)
MILSWIEYEENLDEWDNKVLRIDSINIYQTNGWAKYNELKNWKVIKLVCKTENNEEIAYTHICIKKYLNLIKINYTPGKIIINKLYLYQEKTILLSLIKKIKENCIFSYSRIKISNSTIIENNVNYNICLNRLSAPQTVIIETNKGRMRETYSPHHRRKFKKNIANIFWNYTSDEDNLKSIILILKKLKNEKEIKGKVITFEELKIIIKIIDITIIVGYIDEMPVVGAMVYKINNLAIYMCGGTTYLGRKYNLGYHLIENLNNHLYCQKIDKFDFGGIDLNNDEVNGVNRFKMGFGGVIIENETEIESRQNIASFIINKAIDYIK